MKKTKFVAASVVLALSGWAAAATTVVTDANLANYTDAESITIAAGDTLQFSGITSDFTLSAPVSGGGTLLIDSCTGTVTLAGDNASFSGTLLVTNATMVTVGHVNALGFATVQVVTDSIATNTFLYNVTGEFQNNITLDAKSARVNDSPFRYSVANGHTVTNSGTLTLVQPKASNPRIEFGVNSTKEQMGRLVLTGMLDKKTREAYLYFYAPITFARTFTG